MKPQLQNLMQSLGRTPAESPAAPVDPSDKVMPLQKGIMPGLAGFGSAFAFGRKNPLQQAPEQNPTITAAQPVPMNPNIQKPGGFNPMSARIRKTGLNPATSNTVSTRMRPTSEVTTEPPKLKFSRPMGSATLYGGRRFNG